MELTDLGKGAAQMNILVTGPTGFVGQALVKRLLAEGRHAVRTVLRQEHITFPPGVECVKIPGLEADIDWAAAVSEIDILIHLAARVHVMSDNAEDPLATFRQINVEGTLNMARQALESGVKRFVFVSSIKVCGNETASGHPFTETCEPTPADPYSVSKLEAEKALSALTGDTAMELVIIRPPLVYGPGVKANFLAVLQWLKRGVPLPFGAIYNRRSLVGLDNLVDFICTCIEHPAAADEIFLVSDGEDVSTSELLRRTAKAMGLNARLFPVPAWIINAVAKATGKGDMAQRLLGNLQVDISKAQKVLGWNPPFSLDEELTKTAHWFLQKGQRC